MKGHSAEHPAPFTTLAKTFERKVRKLYAFGQARDFELHTFEIVRPQGTLIGIISIAPRVPVEEED